MGLTSCGRLGGKPGRIRPTYADHMMDWETLTHAEIGSAGIK